MTLFIKIFSYISVKAHPVGHSFEPESLKKMETMPLVVLPRQCLLVEQNECVSFLSSHGV